MKLCSCGVVESWRRIVALMGKELRGGGGGDRGGRIVAGSNNDDDNDDDNDNPRRIRVVRKEENQQWGTNTLTRTVKETHNLMLREKG